MSQTLKTAPIERDAEPTSVSDDLLARIVTETERQVAAKANRPAPIRLRTLDELERFADIAARSTAVPKDYQNKPDNCMIAIQMGSELGLAPMQSLQNIAVINGRPAVWGDAMPGLCRASGMMSYMREWSDGEGEDLAWHCETKRRDDPNPIVQHFSVADAKVAKLWGKKGYQGQDTPWITNPGRMLQLRARGFALRDAFPDVLRGLISAEEAADMTFEASPPPAANAREQMNRDVPLKAAAAATPRAERKVDPTPYEAPKPPHPQMPNGPVDPNPVDAASTAPEKRTWAQWKDALEMAVKDAQTPEERGRLLAKAEVTEIVRLARLGQYSPAKARIIELYEEIENRYLADPPDPPEEPAGELPAVEIVGADKIMAG